MEGKGISFVILLIIVAFLSLTLAALAGYVFFFGTPKASVEVSSKEQTHKKPADAELLIQKLYEGKKYFNLKTTDDKKISVIQVGLELAYYKDPKIKGLKSVEEKHKANEGEIKEIVGTYFQSLTLEDVKLPEAKEKAKKELVRRINEMLLENEKEKKDILYSITFDEWFYQ